MSTTSSINHESISQRAHQIWEETGRQEGNHLEHWLRAESELHAQHGKTDKGANSRGVEPPPAAGKHVSGVAPHSTNYVHPGVTTDSLHHARHK